MCFHLFKVCLAIFFTLAINSSHAGDVVYLDVRSDGEYQQDHLAGSVHIPHKQITNKALGLLHNKGQTIYVFCAAGVRAGYAKTDLEKLGYKNVINIGGLNNAKNHHLVE